MNRPALARRAVALLLLLITLAGPLAAGPASAAPDRPAPHQATGWQLTLGDSLAAGYQPGTPYDLDGGYADDVLTAVRAEHPKTKLVNLACPGETTGSMIDGGRCAYADGSQLAQAVEFLHAHARTTRVVTLTLGANDVVPCAGRSGIDVACIDAGITRVNTELPQVLDALRAAAPDVQIVVTNYYNPFLVYWFTDPALAYQSASLQSALNGAIARAASGADATVADVSAAYHSADFSPLPSGAPTNVATICSLTYMCSQLNIHPNDQGYSVMGQAIVAALS